MDHTRSDPTALRHRLPTTPGRKVVGWIQLDGLLNRSHLVGFRFQQRLQHQHLHHLLDLTFHIQRFWHLQERRKHLEMAMWPDLVPPRLHLQLHLHPKRPRLFSLRLHRFLMQIMPLADGMGARLQRDPRTSSRRSRSFPTTSSRVSTLER